MIQQVELDLDGRTLRIETGRVGRQADGAVLVSMGDTVVLAAATMSHERREGIDFFPLVCDYEERKYAVGKIPGGFVKRGGRPSERAILVSRLIDRPLRPLFPQGMRNEVQVIAIPLSLELANPSDVLAMIAASAALSISRIPFDGPIGAVRVARVDGRFVINPSWEEAESSELNLVMAGADDRIMMVDIESREVDESIVLEAVSYGHQYVKRLIEIQNELVRKAGQPKTQVEFHSVSEEFVQTIRARAGEDILNAVQQVEKAERKTGIAEIVDSLAADFPEQEVEVAEAVEQICKQEVRKLILEKGVRADGRMPDEIRELSSAVGMLPRVHGSGLFTRGQTQVLTAVTLGSIEDAQIVDNLEQDGVKRYMHFYNFTPFSVGETRPLRGPGRREVGHGVLAEKALAQVIPSQDEFPYAILLTSEVLESNGSTSMASVCSSSLALMDAGVGIKAPVAGVAMGLMSDGDKHIVLSDIRDMEDFYGDMDFKIAGTSDGITAGQLDTKIKGIPVAVLGDALAKAKSARLHILSNMLEAISEPRPELSPYAPRVLIIVIHPDKIGDVIGPGGKVIKKLEAETGANISIEQDGRVFITAVDKEAGERALKMVDDITRDIGVGETYVGRVTKTTAFGAFVEILPGREGLVHISQLAPRRVERVEDVVRVGDEIVVKVNEITPQGKIGLTRKGVTQPGEEAAAGPERERERHAPTETGVVQARFRPKH
ncbi:MAG TPA: polyribonucleotide nucleotidyltransferase [Armatimonadota bacterium]|nr:polyribonucleotide nucleotidyltransferase [Armatimonadota bacterium]